jgi:DNA-binding transcriptional MerR regulator
MDEKIIDVEYTAANEKSMEDYYTIDYVAKELDIDESTIIFYCNKFANLLHIQTISQYHVFNDLDIQNLRTIKEKNIDEGLSIKEIREYFNKYNDAIVIPKRNTNELSLINAFSKIINLQNEKMDKIIENQNKILEMGSNIQNNIITKVNQRINEVIADKLDKQSTQLQQKFQSIIDENEKKVTERDEKLTNNLNKILEDRKIQYEKEQENKKHTGFFSSITNIFHHK